MAVSQGTALLNTGAKIPLVGLGTITPNGEEIQAAVATALQVGYRHIDTASFYGSEAPIGQALDRAFEDGVVKREEVFVTTKLWNTEHDDPIAALQASLKNLQLEYVDLYLLHWPVKLRKEASLYSLKEEDFLRLDIESTWRKLEQCVKLGLAKAIGVSNFSCKKLQDLLGYAKIPPAVDQVEMHPLWQQKKLREFCGKQRIHVSAWSPLGAPNQVYGSNQVMENPVIHEIAEKHGKTKAQVMLRWGIEQGVSVLPKSYNKARIAENFQIFDWCLDAEDHEKIGKLPQQKSMRGEIWVNATTSAHKSIQELWDGEI